MPPFPCIIHILWQSFCKVGSIPSDIIVRMRCKALSFSLIGFYPNRHRFLCFLYWYIDSLLALAMTESWQSVMWFAFFSSFFTQANYSMSVVSHTLVGIPIQLKQPCIYFLRVEGHTPKNEDKASSKTVNLKHLMYLIMSIISKFPIQWHVLEGLWRLHSMFGEACKVNMAVTMAGSNPNCFCIHTKRWSFNNAATAILAFLVGWGNTLSNLWIPLTGTLSCLKNEIWILHFYSSNWVSI